MIRPSKVIHSGGEPYLRRWHVIPRNKRFNVYLHHTLKSDDERALHDHPWWSVSFLLRGPLSEVYKKRACFTGNVRRRNIPWLWPVLRHPTDAHSLVLPKGETAWTVFITWRRQRRWGFWCPAGWKYHHDYDRDGGCGEGDD